MTVGNDENSDKDQKLKEAGAKLADLKEQVQEKLDEEEDQGESVLDHPPSTEPEQESSNMSTQTFQEMSGAQQVAAWNAMAGRAKRKGLEVTPVKKFKNHKIGVERLNKLEAKLASNGHRSPAKVGSKKKAATKTAKAKFGHDRTIVKVSENKRFKGSKAFKLFEEMSKWVAKNRGKTVAQLIEETNYRRQDFDWDLKRKQIEVKKL